MKNESKSSRKYLKTDSEDETAQFIRIDSIIKLLLWLYGLSLLLFGLSISAAKEWLPGLGKICFSASALLTDYFELAGPGLAFINAGLMTIFATCLIYFTKVKLSGNLIAALFMLSGFSFFGKNPFNALPFILGVLLYSLAAKKKFKDYLALALFSSCLGPLVSSVAFHLGLPLGLGIISSYLLGLFSGFVLPLLATVFVNFHRGYCLYNMGFTAGLYALLVVSLLVLFGADFASESIIYNKANTAVSSWLMFLVVFLFLAGIAISYLEYRPRKKGAGIKSSCISFCQAYQELLKRPGRLTTDFIELHGYGLSLINMALTGLLGYLYLLLLGSSLNGPVIGALLSMIGFASFGKHPLNCFPILIGVSFASLISGGDMSATNVAISGLLGTALAPMAGSFGIIPGIISGMGHLSIIPWVKNLHAGTNLYNNGFSAGLIALLLYPLFTVLKDKDLLPKQQLGRFLAKIRLKDQD